MICGIKKNKILENIYFVEFYKKFHSIGNLTEINRGIFAGNITPWEISQEVIVNFIVKFIGNFTGIFTGSFILKYISQEVTRKFHWNFTGIFKKISQEVLFCRKFQRKFCMNEIFIEIL